MTAYVALVRAVNVSGTGKLPKDELKAIGEACGFENVRTFINSGNLLFTSELAEREVKQLIEKRLAAFFGKSVPVFVRSSAEMAAIVEMNPFPDEKPSTVMAHFIDEDPVKAMIDEARDARGEKLALGPRILYIAYGGGIASSKLKMPALKYGTARNMNSVTKMAELLAGME